MSETPDDEHTASDGQAPEGSQPPAASEPEPVYGVPDDDEAGLAQGLMVSWAEDLAIADVMAAAIRSALHASGHELAAWGEPGGDDVPAMTSPAPGDAGDGSAAPGAGEVAQADQDLDPLGDSELAASCSDQGTVMPLRDLGGHTRLAPGPNLAGSLAGTRPARLDDAALVTSVTGWRKLTSWAQARELEAVAELARRRGVLANHEAGSPAEVDAEFTPDEIAAALTLTQASASFWMDLAITLAGRLPSTLAALRAGRIDLARARLIETYTSVLDDTLATQVEKRVLAKAEGQTTGQLRAALNSAVLAADPKAAERRRRRAEKNARVELTGEPEGTASLGGRFLPPAAATVAWSHVNDLAEALHEAGVPGGIDQLRAKVFLTLLAGCEPPSPPPGGDRDNNDTPGGDGAGGSHTNKGPNADPDAGDVQDNLGDISREEDPDKGDAKESGPDEEDATEEDPAAEDPARQDPAEDDPAEDGATHEDPEAEDPAEENPAEEDPAEEEPKEEEPEEEDLRGRGRPGAARRDRRPVLTVPWRTLAGMCGLPGQLSRLGPIDAAAALALAGAAAADVTCRWSVLVIGTEGQFLTRIPLRARARPPSK
ncbi:MAG TPA: DUF222 domain-containing protein, partial [Streptosporangiaceae bacterium]|nr:DUF222 domain-containing protein [Streptosporangiaceae bacterium]